ncbi:hypothetical protein BC830DRAFT_38324 [Chytriomyces sp. MP71]|nr:hypothetical protein BC830DRAFT_38324 [Chytriomyces sp. MP71]
MDFDDDLGSGVWGGEPVSKTESAAAALSTLDIVRGGMQSLVLRDEEDEASREGQARAATPVFDPAFYGVDSELSPSAFGFRGDDPLSSDAFGSQVVHASVGAVVNAGVTARHEDLRGWGAHYSEPVSMKAAAFDAGFSADSDGFASYGPSVGGAAVTVTITPKPAVFDPLANIQQTKDEDDIDEAAKTTPADDEQRRKGIFSGLLNRICGLQCDDAAQGYLGHNQINYIK